MTSWIWRGSFLISHRRERAELLLQRLQHLELGEVQMQRRYRDALVVDRVQVGAGGRIGAHALETDPEIGIAARVDAALEIGGLQIALALAGKVDAFDLV